MQSARLRIQCVFPVLALVLATWGQAQEAGTLTLLRDTPLRVIRGISVLQGVEGMRLFPGDVLETASAGTAQTQLEFSANAIIELGPSTQVFLFSQTETVLLTGWLKGETPSGNHRFSSPLASATTKGGNILLHVSENSADIFVERGAATVSYGSQPPVASSADKIFFTRRAGKPVVAAGRPSPEFIGGMPVSFRDDLPSRLSRFTGKKAPEPRRDHDVSYSDVEPLLTLPPIWRKGLVERFSPRLQDRAFRQAIEAHIATLPEWKAALQGAISQ